MGQKIIVIGGGAAGFFGAIHAANANKEMEVLILEKSNKLLSKVKISGGGRCNVTHKRFERSKFSKNYPRGDKFLKQTLGIFDAGNTVEWFAKRNVEIKEEADGRMFPVSDDSQSIVDCLWNEVQRLNIKVYKNCEVQKVVKAGETFTVHCKNGTVFYGDKIMITSGGYPKVGSFKWIEDLGHQIVPPVPSLFTFNVPQHPLKDLSGISLPNSLVKIVGSKLNYQGPLLVTHWGFSGPAVLKLSAFGARFLSDLNYSFKIHIKWAGELQEESLRDDLYKIKDLHPKKTIASHSLWGMPQRLWRRLVFFAEINESTRWADLPKKNFNKLVEYLIRAEFEIKGKTTFKEEFVTCGGVSLSEINSLTMESKICQGLYFAGEVMDVDGITGGFNFQHAWTSGYIAGKNIGSSQPGK